MAKIKRCSFFAPQCSSQHADFDVLVRHCSLYDSTASLQYILLSYLNVPLYDGRKSTTVCLRSVSERSVACVGISDDDECAIWRDDLHYVKLSSTLTRGRYAVGNPWSVSYRINGKLKRRQRVLTTVTNKQWISCTGISRYGFPTAVHASFIVGLSLKGDMQRYITKFMKSSF